jgi:hypothetical protein
LPYRLSARNRQLEVSSDLLFQEYSRKHWIQKLKQTSEKSSCKIRESEGMEGKHD